MGIHLTAETGLCKNLDDLLLLVPLNLRLLSMPIRITYYGAVLSPTQKGRKQLNIRGPDM